MVKNKCTRTYSMTALLNDRTLRNETTKSREQHESGTARLHDCTIARLNAPLDEQTKNIFIYASHLNF